MSSGGEYMGSATKVSGRWFWIIYRYFGYDESGPVSEGWANSRPEAIQAIESSGFPLLSSWPDYRDGRFVGAFERPAKLWRRWQREQKRVGSDVKSARLIEYLYTSCYLEDFDGRMGLHWHRHTVLKKTKNKVWVSRQHEGVTSPDPNGRERVARSLHYGSWLEPPEVVVLDRHTLDSKGNVWVRGLRTIFHTQANYERKDREAQSRPWFAKVLGIEFPATLDAIQASFRKLARQHHPDCGGDSTTFIRLKEAYDAAVAVA